MRRRQVIGGAAAAVATGVGPVASRAADAMRDIPLGAILALTGPFAIYAIGDAASVRLAVKEIEADGGFEVAGQHYKFALREEDTGSRPQQTVTAAQKMLDTGDVRFIVGPTTTGDWIPAWGLMSKADVIDISFATGALPYLGTPAGKNLFFPNRGVRGPVDATVAVVVEKWDPKTAAMLIPGDAVGQVVGPMFREALGRSGIKLVFDSSFTTTSREFSSALTAVKAAQPDILISGYFDDMMSTVMRQAVELGAARKFVGMRGVSEASGEPLKGQFDGLIFPLVARDPSEPSMKDFNASYEKFVGKKADRTVANGIGLHDAIMMLSVAMQKAGSVTDVDKISSAMREVTSYPHSTLGLRFEPSGFANHVQTIGYLNGATGKTEFVPWSA